MADFATTFDGWDRFQEVTNANLDTLFGEFVTERNATSMERFDGSWQTSASASLPSKGTVVVDLKGAGGVPGGATYGCVPFYPIINGTTYSGAGDPFVVTDINDGRATILNLAAAAVDFRILTLNPSLGYYVFTPMPYPPAIGKSFNALKMLKNDIDSTANSNTKHFEGLINAQGGASLIPCWKRMGSTDSTPSGWRTLASAATATFTHNLGYIPHQFYVTCRDTTTLRTLTLNPLYVKTSTTTTITVINLSAVSVEVALHYRAGRPDEGGTPAALALPHNSTGTWVTPGSGYTKFKAADFLENWAEIQWDLTLNSSKRFAAKVNSIAGADVAAGASRTVTHSAGFYVMFRELASAPGGGGGNPTGSGYPLILTGADTNSLTWKNCSGSIVWLAGNYWN